MITVAECDAAFWSEFPPRAEWVGRGSLKYESEERVPPPPHFPPKQNPL